jgi:hypothetical protein
MVMTSSALGYDTPAPAPEQEAELVADKPTKAKFSIESMTDADDGGLDMVLNMDYESLVAFARIGLMKVLEDAAKKAIAEHGPA